MKILFVSEGYPSKEKPQYCIFLQQQAYALCKIGNTVDVLHIQKNSIKENTEYKYQLGGIDIFSWNYKTNKISELLFLPKTKSNIYNFLKQNNYDIVHLHIGNLRPFIHIVKICKKLSIPVVMHFAGLNIWNDYYETWKHKIHNRYRNIFKKRLVNKLDTCICISNIVSDVLKTKAPNVPIHVVYNGVDCDLFGEKNKNNDVFTVVCVGNLIEIKGQEYLIKAVGKLINNQKQIKLIIIGEGTNFEKLKKLTAELNITNNVIFTGSIPYEQVSEKMQIADMFILPSFFEGLGCVYLESMACGVLTCGCNGNNGIKEIINDKVNGFLVKEKDSDAIAQVIEYVMKNPEDAQKIAYAGKETAHRFTWENSAETLAKVYKSLL